MPPIPFVGYVKANRRPDGLMEIFRLTDFGSPACDRAAFDVAARMPFKGQAIQCYIVTPPEVAALHGGKA